MQHNHKEVHHVKLITRYVHYNKTLCEIGVNERTDGRTDGKHMPLAAHYRRRTHKISLRLELGLGLAKG